MGVGIALERSLRLDDPEVEHDELDTELDRLLSRRDTERRTVPGRGSVYERRELSWRDRLRRLVGREKPPAPLCDPPRMSEDAKFALGY